MSGKVNVPRLRFPEFRDKGVWEEKKLGQVVDYENGKAHEQDIDEQGKYIVVNSKFISTEGEVKKFSDFANLIAKTGDILMVLSDVPNGRAIAKCFLVEKDDAYTVNQRICKLTSKNAVSLLLFYIFDRNPYFLAFDDGVKQTNLKKEDVLGCPVLLPRDQKEQKKIADCLSSLDELITLEAQKLDTLKTHKKGLMQQLFPAEGETLPKLRFPEFRDKGDWVEKTLGQVADYENGKAHEQDIDEQGKYIVVNSKFISTEGEVKKFSDVPNLIAKTGDILMVLSDVPNGRAIAKCFLVEKDDAYTVNQRICRLTSKNTVSLLLFYIFDRNPYFLAFDDGVKQTNLKKEDVLGCPVLLPRDKKEQQKIADCLSSLDDLIAARTQKLDTLKNHKKGLMQQLFPQLSEVHA